MRNLVQCGLLAAVIVGGGCAAQQSQKPEAVAVAVRPVETYSQLKAAYLNANPDAKVGRVSAVLPGQNILSVDDVTTSDFGAGDVLTFVDHQFNVVADGTVTNVGTELVFVHYTPPLGGSGRTPEVGDMAIRPAPDTSTDAK